MSTVYPSARVVLIMRLDDPAGEEDLEAVVQTDAVISGKVLEDAVTGTAAFAELPRSEDRLAVVAGVVPRRVVVRRNDIRDADECSLVFDANYLPIDPRYIRAMAVQVYAGAVTADEYSIGMRGGDSERHRATVSSVRENLRAVGWADEGSWRLRDGEVSIDVRGFQALLMDGRPPGSVTSELDLDTPLEAAVRVLVAANPMTRGMGVEVRGAESSPNVAAPLAEHLRRRKGKKWRLPLVDRGESYWDAITRLCLLVGWVASVDLDQVVLQPGRTTWAGPAGTSSPARFIFGQDLADLELRRPWARATRSPIEVYCWVPGERKRLAARYPAGKVAARVAASGRVATEEPDVMVVSGIRDQATLDEVARNVWLERQFDLLGSFSTREMSWLGLKGGDAIEVRLARARRAGESTPELYEGLSRPELIDLLVSKRGIDQVTAERFAAVLRGRRREPLFRARSAEHVWDADEGYTLSVDFAALLRGGVIDSEELSSD